MTLLIGIFLKKLRQKNYNLILFLLHWKRNGFTSFIGRALMGYCRRLMVAKDTQTEQSFKKFLL